MGASRWRDRPYLLELFIIANLAFLALDIYLAHSINAFAHPAEWVPFAFSLAAPLVLMPVIWRRDPGCSNCRVPGMALGYAAVVVGIAGLFYHLESRFFGDLTLESLVYTAPFTAPLAYAGLGFLLLLNRMVTRDSVEWGRWVTLLAMAGFVGNFALSLADHAQNGFFQVEEWIPVFASAFATSFLFMALIRYRNRPLLKWSLAVMVLQVVVGVLGFYFHLAADLSGSSQSLRDNFIYGAPIFAPLLCANLAIPGAIGLWSLKGGVA